MDKFYIIANRRKEEAVETIETIKEYLQRHGKECFVSENLKADEESVYTFTNPENIPEDIDCILTLGGDGTLIQTARDVVRLDIPLLGVNFGTLGYLTEIEKHKICPALDKLMADEYEVEERMMLKGSVEKNGILSGKSVALNDIVISRTGSVRIINFKIYVNNEYLHSYNADGIIVSTPTGSTGYSLSAGGPIVEPSAAMIVITPVCPHTLNTRSIVLSDHDRIKIEIGPGRKTALEEAEAAFDGADPIKLFTGDTITICRANYKTKILKIGKGSFLETLRIKMGEFN